MYCNRKWYNSLLYIARWIVNGLMGLAKYRGEKKKELSYKDTKAMPISELQIGLNYLLNYAILKLND